MNTASDGVGRSSANSM